MKLIHRLKIILVITLIYFVLLAKTKSAFAVDQKFIDSIKTVLSKTKNVDDSLNLLYTLSFETGHNNPELAIQYGRQCLAIAIREKDLSAQVNANNGIGNAFESLSDFDSSRHYHFQSLKLARQINSMHKQSASLSNIAITYSEQGNYDEALKYFLEAYQIGELNKTLNVKIFYYINDMYLSLGDTQSAMKYARTGMQRMKRDDWISPYFTFNFGRCLFAIGKHDSALLLLQDSYTQLKNSTEALLLAKCLTSMGQVYFVLGNADSAIICYSKAIQLFQKLNHHDGICISSLSLADLLASLPQQNLNRIEELLKTGIGEFKFIRKNKDNLKRGYQIAASVYEHLTQYESALHYQKLFFALSDSILNEKKFMQINELQTKFETSEKEKKISEQEISIRQRNYQLVLLAVVFVFILLFGFFFYHRNKAIQQLKFTAELQRKENEERERISKDIHDELGSGLSKIALLSSLTAPMVSNENMATENIQSISKITSDLNENMRDLVWTLNPNNNTLDNLFARMREYASEYLENFPVKLVIDFQDDFPSTAISKEVQRNIFLVMKEALNNIVKHAKATELRMSAQFTESKIKIEVTDNGIGFENSKIRIASNGLRNMNERIISIGGTLNISFTNPGTKIKIEVPL